MFLRLFVVLAFALCNVVNAFCPCGPNGCTPNPIHLAMAETAPSSDDLAFSTAPNSNDLPAMDKNNDDDLNAQNNTDSNNGNDMINQGARQGFEREMPADPFADQNQLNESLENEGPSEADNLNE